MNQEFGLKILIWLLLILLISSALLFGIFYKADLSIAYLEQKYTDAESRFMDVGGIRTHYKIEGKGPFLVLIHGTAASLHTWDDWVKHLADDFTLVRLDIPAFGLTGVTRERDYSIEFYSQFLDAFVSQLGIDRFSLAGNSLGGSIAWYYATQYSAKVERLILIDAGGIPGRSLPPIFTIAQNPLGGFLLTRLSSRWFIQQNMQQVYFDDSKITDQLVDRYWELGLRVGARQAFVDRARMPLQIHDHLLYDLQTPTLVMWGRDDQWIPVENAYEFDKRLPNSQLIIYDNVGHVPMEEIPRQTADDARDFLLQ
jgi:pimeloyl-ACP methyl ester carboxylesterase